MTVAQLQTRVLTRLDEDTSFPTFYTAAEALAALNEGQRFFVLLTLGLETTATFQLTASQTFYHMRSIFQDWILPLRVYTPAGLHLQPVRLDDLDAIDQGWQARAVDWTTDTRIRRYVALGFDFFVVYPQPTASGTSLNITYARAPKQLQAAGDTPEIPEDYHPALADYAVYRLRFKEGGQEFARELPRLNRFLDEAQKYSAYVRARSLGSRYDKLPFELERYDRSRLLQFRPDLPPLKRI